MTNKEIAKTLGISPAAFSMIINHKPGISEATRASVILKLEQMGYGHLVKTETAPPVVQKLLCFVVYLKHGKILNQHPFFLLLMESIENRARDFGCHVIVNTIDSAMPIDPQIDRISETKAEGVILFATEMTEADMLPFSRLTIPFVALDNAFPYLNVSTIAINNQMGTHQAIEYLVQNGHKKIGYLQSLDVIESFLERKDGYAAAMKRFGLEANKQFVFPVHYSEEGCFHDMLDLLESGRPLPTAFVCDDDTIAAGAMRALLQKGISIPETVSVIGFNDRPLAAMTQPGLTTINVPRYSFGQYAVDEIVSLIQKYKEDPTTIRSKKIRIGTQLIVRESVQKIQPSEED